MVMRGFPEEHEGENKLFGRRRFLRDAVFAIGGFIAAVLAYPAIRYVIDPALRRKEETNWTRIATTSQIPVGRPTYITYEERLKDGWTVRSFAKGAWVVTLDGKSFTVFDPHCTHLGCAYSWMEKGWWKEGPYKGQPHFHCPCHEGIFAIDGTVISGPPPRPLDRLEHKVENGALFVGGIIRSMS